MYGMLRLLPVRRSLGSANNLLRWALRARNERSPRGMLANYGLCLWLVVLIHLLEGRREQARLLPSRKDAPAARLSPYVAATALILSSLFLILWH